MELKRNAPQEYGRIGVLMGGPSNEREISLKSGKTVCESLNQAQIDFAAIDIRTAERKANIDLLKSQNIDCAFVALHGHFGEDGKIQEILESLEIPYTGSGVSASRLAMDKIASRRIFERHGLNVPAYQVLQKNKEGRNWGLDTDFRYPLVVKPAGCGSSIGVSFVCRQEDLSRALDLAYTFDENILVEEYISGREITVGILDETALPVIEILPRNKFFDYHAKYQPGITEYIVPAEIDQKISLRLKEAGLSAHKLLGCYGCSRVDMILSGENQPVILEVNSIPGLTPTSLLPKAAKSAGIDFTHLCLKLIELAYEKAQVKIADSYLKGS